MASFSIALSGLTAASSDLDVTANNIANSNTVGFKESRAEFADVFAAGAVNLNTSAVGEGVRLATTAQQFTQGNISTSGSNLDLAISGDGFFTLQDPSNGIVYTRNGQFSEDKNGNVVTATGQALQVYPPTTTGGFNTGALTDLNLQTAQSTQFGGGFGVTSIIQNGFATGQLSTVSIDPTGVVSAVYTNGRSTQLGQLALANFPDAQGLKQLGDTNWAETFTSGTHISGTAGSAGFGSIQSGALEASNVDLTTQLVNMITAQRAFQANAQVITTSNQLSQTVINITH